ncbi:heavy metal-associated isoprenylated plant protein 6-like [Silene latifolia]|uniref:heavy metal-associated isoprenylated plant protein 6-like n=1 Tax=Silene latifolia TaxID=37657 RepID=UPI003D775916
MGEKQEKIAKNNEGEKKSDGGVNSIVLKFDMHCEGCAKKVRKSINKLQGVESVKTDVSNNKLMVTGKVDPVMVKEKVEEKMKKKAELVSLQPNKSAKEGGSGGGDNGGKKKSDDKKPEEKKSEAKPDDKKKSEGKADDKKKSEGKSDDKKKSEDKEKPKEPPVATVQLKTRVHCEGCAQKIKKIVSKCEGVQDVNVDLQKDLITTKGTMNMKDLLPYLNVKLKRAVELAPAKKDQAAAGDKKTKDAGKENEKPKEGGGKSEKPKGSDNADKKDSSGDKKEGGGDKKEGGGGEKKKGGNNGAEASSSKDNSSRIEVSRMEYNPYGYDQAYSYAYDPRQQREGYGHQVVEYWHAPEFSQPPQMFSDENPNACSLM